jgi:hypothetical protein
MTQEREEATVAYQYTRIDGQRVEVHVAAAYARLKADFEKAFPGLTLLITSGTRTAAEQKKLRDAYLAGKGGLAAPVGRSNHEETGPRGPRALDIRDSGSDPGVTRFGTVRAKWLRANAASHGFDPAGYWFSQVEPWHYEFTGKVGGPAPAGSGGTPAETGDEFMAKIDDLWQRLLPGEKNVKTAGDVYLLFVDVVQRVRTAVADTTKAVWDQPVRRDGKNVSALQELADAKTLGMQNGAKLDELLKRPAASVSLTDAQVDTLAAKVGEKVALAVAPAVLDAMSARLKA